MKKFIHIAVLIPCLFSMVQASSFIEPATVAPENALQREARAMIEEKVLTPLRKKDVTITRRMFSRTMMPANTYVARIAQTAHNQRLPFTVTVIKVDGENVLVTRGYYDLATKTLTKLDH